MKKKINIVALVPMKANSTRVKNKNFLNFCGKPLFKWVIDTLLSLPEIDLIVINTDARELLAENNFFETDRVLIRDRKPEICGDDVSMNLVLADDLSHIDANLYLMTHTTNPFLSQKTIRDAIERFKMARINENADSLFTVNKVQSRFYTSSGSPVNHDPENLVPTQALTAWFEENSNLYIFTKDGFTKTNARIGRRPVLYQSPIFESIDIDTPEDWDFAVAVEGYLSGKTKKG